jgi:hypothetical protein
MNNRIGDNLVHFGANEKLVCALLNTGVKFVVIGGLAVAWYCPERQADDMDLLVEPSAENSALVAAALASLRLHGFTADSFAKAGLQVPLKSGYYAELLTPGLDSPAFSETEAQAVQAKLFNLPVLIASVSTLIAMKKHAAQAEPAQRKKHLDDICLLERHSFR